MIGKKIKVLVVDDSAFMRKAISNMIDSDPSLEVVGTARDGEDGISKIASLKPDLVTLDIEMPRMDGLTALKIIMEKMPLPVLMLSSLTVEGAHATLQALEIGAVDFIPKNLDNLSLNIVQVRDDLVAKIKAVGQKKIAFKKFAPVSQMGAAISAFQGAAPLLHLAMTQKASHGKASIVAIGTSTGGPKALQDVLSQIPKDFPVGIVIVQHMPTSFIPPFAERLNQLSAIHVKAAEDGEAVKPGIALIAPGECHLTFRRVHSAEVRVKLNPEPSNSLHRPSVDQMALSVAQVYGGSSIGVILTGMGHDGRDGMKAIKESHGRIVAQNEESCVVYGMPKAVVDLGIADKIVPLSSVAGELINMV
jgi:two-component system chemotaxis response regulator CheB